MESPNTPTQAVEIFNKLKAWHYSGHFTELIESVRTQSGKGRAVIATMLNEMETSMDELIEIKTEVRDKDRIENRNSPHTSPFLIFPFF